MPFGAMQYHTVLYYGAVLYYGMARRRGAPGKDRRVALARVRLVADTTPLALPQCEDRPFCSGGIAPRITLRNCVSHTSVTFSNAFSRFISPFEYSKCFLEWNGLEWDGKGRDRYGLIGGYGVVWYVWYGMVCGR